jgi:hypothetical protein
MKKHTKNVYQRHVELENETNFEEGLYITDLNGTLHDLSGNLESKLESIRKTLSHWKKVYSDKKDDKSKFFLDNFTHLYKQVLIYLETKKELELD